MRIFHRLWATSAVAALAACTADFVTGPAADVQPASPWVRYGDFQASVASEIRAYLAEADPPRERRDALAAVMNAAAQQAELARRVTRGADRVRWDMAPATEVEKAGLFDPAGTFTDINLYIGDIAVFSKVTIPAMLSVSVNGSSVSNGREFPISHNASTSPFVSIGFLTKVGLREVDCYSAPASANVSTDHSAGWHVFGQGWVPAHMRTIDFEDCNGPPAPCNPGPRENPDEPTISSMSATDPGYDPYDSGSSDCEGSDGGSGSGIPYSPGDFTGGETVDWGTGVGNGGVSVCGKEAMVEYVCIDFWNDGEQKWDAWSCGYSTTC